MCYHVKELYVFNRLICFDTALVGLLKSELRLLRCSGVTALWRLHQQLFVLVVLEVPVFIYVGLFAYESRFKVYHYRINKIIKRLWQNFVFE